MIERCEALARCSEQPDALTRVYLSAQQREANELVTAWMRDAGMSAALDAVGNVVGRYEGEQPGLPCLMLGSHLDTVRDAGKYDGMLGVVAAIECVAALHAPRAAPAVRDRGRRASPTRRACASTPRCSAVARSRGPSIRRNLDRVDAEGVSMRDAMRDFGLDPASFALRGAPSRGGAGLCGAAHRAGTRARRRGSCASAWSPRSTAAIASRSRSPAWPDTPERCRCVCVATRSPPPPTACSRSSALPREQPELVGTVGKIEALPGAINVIPGTRSLLARRARADRYASAGARSTAMRHAFAAIASRRGVAIDITPVWEASTAPARHGCRSRSRKPSPPKGCTCGACLRAQGTTAWRWSPSPTIGMLFVRCKGGISHNPAEAITRADAEVAARVFLRFIERFRARESA